MVEKLMDDYLKERSELEIDLEHNDDIRYQNHSDYKDYKDFEEAEFERSEKSTVDRSRSLSVEQCGVKVINEEDLRVHIRMIHDKGRPMGRESIEQSDKKDFNASKGWLYRFLSRNYLTGSDIISFHERKEYDDDEKNFSCEQCGERFSLKTHMSTHTGEPPHVCDSSTSTASEHHAGKQVLRGQHVKNEDGEIERFVQRFIQRMFQEGTRFDVSIQVSMEAYAKSIEKIPVFRKGENASPVTDVEMMLENVSQYSYISTRDNAVDILTKRKTETQDFYGLFLYGVFDKASMRKMVKLVKREHAWEIRMFEHGEDRDGSMTVPVTNQEANLLDVKNKSRFEESGGE